MLKREQNYVASSLPKKPSGPKHIICHHYGAFGHLRSHCYKFQTLKKIKRKEKLELLGSYSLQAKSNLIESGKLLKHMVNALTSLSICVSDSHSFNPCLTSHETLTPNNRSVWMRNDSYSWAYALFVLIRLNLFNHVLTLFRTKFAYNLAIRYFVFKWELCKGSVWESVKKSPEVCNSRESRDWISWLASPQNGTRVKHARGVEGSWQL